MFQVHSLTPEEITPEALREVLRVIFLFSTHLDLFGFNGLHYVLDMVTEELNQSRRVDQSKHGQADSVQGCQALVIGELSLPAEDAIGNIQGQLVFILGESAKEHHTLKTSQQTINHDQFSKLKCSSTVERSFFIMQMRVADLLVNLCSATWIASSWQCFASLHMMLITNSSNMLLPESSMATRIWNNNKGTSLCMH